MTIQDAAYQILTELGKPINSKEIARIAITKNMVSSTAIDPVQSHAATIDKNIREDKYNNPKLIHIHSARGRLTGLPGWDTPATSANHQQKQNLYELRVQIPAELFENIRLAEQAKLKNSLDETVSLILTEGLSSLSGEIKKRLMERLDSLN